MYGNIITFVPGDMYDYWTGASISAAIDGHIVRNRNNTWNHLDLETDYRWW